MPWKTTLDRAAKDKRQGKAATTQAGEFVKEEMEHIRRGKHGARSAKQAIAIGLSKARRAGVDLAAPKEGTTSERTRKSAERDEKAGRKSAAKRTRPSAKRSRAAESALKREGHSAASKQALSRQAKSAAKKRSPAERSGAAKKAAKTKGSAERSTAARKAAKTRKRSTTAAKRKTAKS